MEINYTNSREDIINFHMQHYTKTKRYRILLITYLVVIILPTLYLLMLVRIFNIPTDIITIITVIIIDLIFILFRKIYFKICFKIRLNRVYNYDKTNSYFYKTKLTTSEDYLNLSTDLDRKSYKWKSIHGVYLIDNYIFITTTAHDDILIPLSCFNSPQETNSFLSTILKSSNSELKRSYPVDIRYR